MGAVEGFGARGLCPFLTLSQGQFLPVHVYVFSLFPLIPSGDEGEYQPESGLVCLSLSMFTICDSQAAPIACDPTDDTTHGQHPAVLD